jgi:hypothetical protein
MKLTIQQSNRHLIEKIKKGELPTYSDFRNVTFKNKVLISLAKKLCVQVIQFQTVKVFIFVSLTADIDHLIYKPENSPE